MYLFVIVRKNYKLQFLFQKNWKSDVWLKREPHKEKQQQNHSELQLLISSVVYLSVVCTQTKEAFMYS